MDVGVAGIGVAADVAGFAATGVGVCGSSAGVWMLIVSCCCY